jgi:prepilin-type N-terminal cleavage/methylation domain-containing protein
MSRRAFTLIELLVTVAIIGILTVVAAVSYGGVRTRGRDAQRINDLNQMKVVLSTFYSAQTPQAYVSATTKTTIDGTSDALSTALEGGGYMREVPVDPLNTGNYLYKYQSFNNGRDFTLFGTLENTANKKGWGGGTSWVADGLQIKND